MAKKLYCIDCKGERPNKGWKNTKAKRCRSCANKIKWQDSEYREHMIKAHKGKKPTNLEQLINNAKSKEFRTKQSKLGKKRIGEKNTNWKGDEVGYGGLHAWVKRHKGKPNQCELCEMFHESGHMLDWANKSGEYKRELNDWLRLCRTCHGKYDSERRVN